MVDLLMEPLFRFGRYSELLAILEQTLKSGMLSNAYFIFHARSLFALGRHEQALVELNIVEAELKDEPEWRAAILIDKGNLIRRSGDVSRADEILGAFREAYEIYDYRIIPSAETENDKSRGLRNKAKALFAEGAILQYFLSRPERGDAKIRRRVGDFQASANQGRGRNSGYLQANG